MSPSVVLPDGFRDVRIGLALGSVVDVDGGVVGGNLGLLHVPVRVRLPRPATVNDRYAKRGLSISCFSSFHGENVGNYRPAKIDFGELKPNV